MYKDALPYTDVLVLCDGYYEPDCRAQRAKGVPRTQVGAEFLGRHYPVKTVLLPSPTWPSHNKIFPLAGMTDVRAYRYFKPSTRGLDYEVGLSKAVTQSVCMHALVRSGCG